MENEARFCTLFAELFEKNGLGSLVTDECIRQFAHLTELIRETNAVMNLTAITDVEKMIPLHFADCAMIAGLLPQNASLLDVGCGGGFPTLPLAILRPDLHITALDSTEKKVRFVADAARRLGVSVATLSGRAEELACDPTYREGFDIVTSRAVARLNILDELCLPFVRVGGFMVTMKGAAGQAELDEARQGISALGGTRVELSRQTLYLTDTSEQRTTIVIRKGKPTPAAYPRVFAKMKKNPL